MLNLLKEKLKGGHLTWSRRSRAMLLSMLLLCAVAGVLWSGAASSVRSSSSVQQADKGPALSPLARINEKARAAKGADPAAIGELTDEIFDVVGFPQVSSLTLKDMKDRVVRSEISYRSTGIGGIPEKNIVGMINNLTDKLSLPNYAKVDGIWVRQVRVRLFTRLPNFFSQAVTKEENGKGGVGSALKTEMSPLEATFLAGFLLQQKMNNESFQATPQEFRADLRQKENQRWHAFRKFKDTGQKGALPREAPKEGLSFQEPGSRSTEMGQAMSRAKANMKSTDLFNLAASSLDDLGIAR